MLTNYISYENQNLLGVLLLIDGIRRMGRLWTLQKEGAPAIEKITELGKSALLITGALLLMNDVGNYSFASVGGDVPELNGYFGGGAWDFNRTDPRPKLLSVWSHEDFWLNFRPDIIQGTTSKGEHLKYLSTFFDLKIVFIEKTQQLCNEIYGSKIFGGLTGAIITAHGEWDAIQWSKGNILDLETLVPKNCFDGFVPNATIFLMSCLTGSSKKGIAQHLANLSGVPVVGPTTSIRHIYHKLMNHSKSVVSKYDPILQLGYAKDKELKPSLRIFYPPSTHQLFPFTLQQIALTVACVYLAAQTARLAMAGYAKLKKLKVS